MPAPRSSTPKRRLSAAKTPLTAAASARPTKKGGQTRSGRRPLDAAAKALLATLRAREVELEAKLVELPELPEAGAGGDDVHLVAEALVADNAQKSFYVSQLASTRESIAAIAKGKHGICLHCQEPIPQARLEILPDATACVPCASGKRR